jgi:ribosomal protein S27AE
MDVLQDGRFVRTERVCDKCGAINGLDERYCGECGADLTESERSGHKASSRQKHKPPREKVALSSQIQPLGKEKNPDLTPPLVPAKKRLPRRGPASPSIFIVIALILACGVGFFAYNFFLSQGGAAPSQDAPDPAAISEDFGFTGGEFVARTETPAPATQDNSSLGAGLGYVWSADDANGYSSLAPQDSSGAVSGIKGTVLGDRVRLRAEPNTNARILSHFDKGEPIEVLRRYSSGSEKFYWFNVRGKGRTGWMYGEYVGAAVE